MMDATAPGRLDEQSLFLDCLDLPPEGREAVLADVPEALAQRVRKLLAAVEEAEAQGRTIASAAHAPMMPEVGQYRLLQRLGEGGMGDVYLAAQHAPLRRLVALKVLKPMLGSIEFANRFAVERQALALMNHPGIARVFDAGTASDGRPYLVMEFVPGLPITQYCRERALSLTARVQLVIAVCSAVQHAHFKGVIHRDLKPSNVLVAETDGVATPKVIDFGVAKLLQPGEETSASHTRIGLAIGTPAYMSPEQAAAGPIDLDSRSDVWSLGAVLHELLVGVTPPTLAATADAPPRPSRTLIAQLDAEGHAQRCGFSSAKSLAAALADELDWIVSKALARDRNERYGSPAELARDLERYLARAPVDARPPSLGYRARKFVARHRVAVAVTATAAVAMVGLTVMTALNARELAAERDRANREAQAARDVTAFTAGVFRLAAPGESGASGEGVTARALLDAAVRQLRQRASQDSPATRASLLEAAGEAYHGLGLHSQAAPLLDEAVSLRRELEDPAALSQALLSRAVLSMSAGDLAAAEAQATEAVKLRESLDDADGMAEARLTLGETLRRRGEPERGVALVAPVLADLQRRADASPALVGQAYFRLGRLEFARGDPARAQQLIEQALPLQQQLHGNDSVEVMETHNALAEVLLTRGDLAGAEQQVRQTVDISRRVYGDEHPVTASALNNLGNVLSDIPEKYEEAKQAYLEAADYHRRFPQSSPVERATVANNLGALYLRLQDWRGAEQFYDEALEVRIGVLGAKHPDTAASKVGKALAINKLDRVNEAELLLRESVEVFAEALGPDHWRTANARRYLGLVLTTLKSYDEAEMQLRAAHDAFQRQFGPDHAYTKGARQYLADLDAARRAARRAR